MMNAQGVYTVCPTPFDINGDLDLTSLRKLVDFLLDAGIHGLAILGISGEVQKLSAFERRRIVETVVSQNKGTVPVWVGVRASGTAGAIEQAQNAEGLGATAVFVAPPDNGSGGELVDHYRRISDSIRIPVIIHESEGTNGASPGIELLAQLTRESNIYAVKLEASPIGPKISHLHKLTDAKIQIFGGLGGVHFLEELERGAAGTMTGFSFPEILLRIYSLYMAGEKQEASQVFDRYCPLIRYEFQPHISVALRKYTYMKRGIIATDAQRNPAVRIDSITQRELAGVIARVGLTLEAHGVQILS